MVSSFRVSGRDLAAFHAITLDDEPDDKHRGVAAAGTNVEDGATRISWCARKRWPQAGAGKKSADAPLAGGRSVVTDRLLKGRAWPWMRRGTRAARLTSIMAVRQTAERGPSGRRVGPFGHAVVRVITLHGPKVGKCGAHSSTFVAVLGRMRGRDRVGRFHIDNDNRKDKTMCPDYRTFSVSALKALFDEAARGAALQQQMQLAIKRELDRRTAPRRTPPGPRR